MDRILVGVDGSPGSVAAISWALELAQHTGAKVEVLHAWELSYGWIDGYAPDIQRWAQESAIVARERLDTAIESALHGRPAPEGIIRTTVEGQAARTLLEHAKDADLLVVGSRGRGGFAGLLLGSVSDQCVHHATVPVVVVPEAD